MDVAPASLTYEPFYGLREKPFSLSSDPRFLYTGPSHARAFEQLLAGIKRREGVIVLSGEIGTGKTTLCRGVLGALDRRTFTTFVRDPFLSREDLLKTLLIDFGVMSIDDLKSGRLNGATRPDLSYPLYEFLDALVPLQAFAVLIIDEAQNLSHSLLEEIRILSELETGEKLLQVVLVGQPELRSHLKLPQLRQVDQRVSVRCELAPLPVDDAARYIAHRLSVASVGAPAVEFTPEAARLAARASGGVPRVINLICDRALHRGFVARANHIDAAIVYGAVQELGRAVEPEPAAPVPVVPTLPRAAAPFEVPSAVRDAAASRSVAGGAPADVRPLAPAAPAAMPSAPPEAAGIEPARPCHEEPLPEPAGEQPGEMATLAGTASFVGHPDPLSEFSQEADLHGTSRAWRKTAIAAVIVGLAAAAAAGVWLIGRAPAPPTQASATVDHPAAAPDAAPVQAETAPATLAALVEPPAVDPQPVPGAMTPDVASGETYAIQVASLQSRARAQRLLEELSAAGYYAEGVEVDLGERGIWIRVLVGRYTARAEADATLVDIRDRPSYGDAHIVVVN